MNKLIFIFFLTLNSQIIFAQENNIEDLTNRVSELEKQLSDSLNKGNSFNPAISLIFDGTYKNYKLDPSNYSIAGFLGSGHAHGTDTTSTETALGTNGFSVGHSELVLSGAIDPFHTGRVTIAVDGDSNVELEEVFFTNTGLAQGLNVSVGKFLPAIGYLNEKHRHTWDFSNTSLINQAFWGEEAYRDEGVQLNYVLPFENYFEMGAMKGRGENFPGTSRTNGLNSNLLFAKFGQDLGFSSSYKFGLSWFSNRVIERDHEDHVEREIAGEETEVETENHFENAESKTIGFDFIYKWFGEDGIKGFTLQTEYFKREEDGNLHFAKDNDTISDEEGTFTSEQSGYYIQAVYRFTRTLRLGYRYDKLDSGTWTFVGEAGSSWDDLGLESLAEYNPTRNTIMLDYSPSEFSRFRLQFAQDKSRNITESITDNVDNQITLQYIHSLGSHGAHQY